MQSKPQPNQYVYFKTALPLKKTHQGHLSKWLTWPRLTFLNGSALYLQNIVITMVANEVTKLGEKLGWMGCENIYRGTQQLVLKLIFWFLFIYF